MRHHHRGLSKATFAPLLLVFGCLTPAAQALEEVVVTAQKRAESIQDVPIAMQAFTGETISELGLRTADDVIGLVANASLAAQGGAKQNFFIRGVGSADFHLNVVGAVGVYLDEVSINSPFAVGFSLYDMERVEVLRGPQNTLFGRNTTGGAVTYVTRKPQVEDGLNGYVTGTYGRYNQMDFEGAVGFPLGETAAARVALFSNDRDGPFNNRTLGIEEGDIQKQGGRGQLAWDPTDDLSVLFNLHGGVSRGSPYPFPITGTLDPNDLTQPCAVPVERLKPHFHPNCADSTGFVHPLNADWEDTFGNQPFEEDINLWGTNVKLEYQFLGLTLTSITAFDYYDVRYAEETDSNPLSTFQFYQAGEYDQWSQDFRLQSASDQEFRWMVGLSYFFEDTQYATTVRRTPAPLAPAGFGFFNIVPNTQVDQENEVYSGYFQVEYDLQEDLKLTFGYRLTKETKTGLNKASVRCLGTIGAPPFCPPDPGNVLFDRDVLNSLPVLFAPPDSVLDGDWSEWGARFALDYRVTDDALVYVSISRGFKGGGFSIAALQSLTGLGAQPVEPERLVAYEIGGKSDWLDNTLRVNGAVFFYRWDGLQSFQPLFDPASGIAIPQLLNVPEAELLGGEVEIQWAPDESWLIQAGVGYTDAEIADAGLIANVSDGNDIPATPEYSFTGLVRKDFQIGPGTLSLQSNFRYQDDVTYDLANSPAMSEDGYWDVGARGAYTFGPEGQYEVALWGKNLTEEEVCNGYTSLEGLTEGRLCVKDLSEATYGITASVRFE